MMPVVVIVIDRFGQDEYERRREVGSPGERTGDVRVLLPFVH